jgi:hypothetical protein
MTITQISVLPAFEDTQNRKKLWKSGRRCLRAAEEVGER